MTSKSAVVGLVVFALCAATPVALAFPVEVGSDAALEATTDLEVQADALPGLGAIELSGPGGLAAPGLEAGLDQQETAHVQSASGSGTEGEGILATPVPASVAAATAATGLALLIALATKYGGALAAALFSRLQGQDVLQNDVRHRIHDAIAHNPGITIKELTAVCSVGWGTAVYHLRRLEGERLVVSERVRQFRRFYKNGGGIVNDAKAAYGELKSDTGSRLAREILKEPGRCQKDLCEKVGVSAPVAHKYIRRLREAGLVHEEREWKSVRYFPTPQLTELLAAAGSALPPLVASTTEAAVVAA